MTEHFWRPFAVVCALVCLAATGLAGARPDGPDKDKKATRHAPGVARPVGSTSTAAASAGTRATAIVGTAWTADNMPIKQPILRLRNVVNGSIQTTTIGSDAGQFGFENVPGGSYVVELVSITGHVQAVGHVISIEQGETVATFIRLAAKVPWFNGFFSNTVASVASAAAVGGVTAIAPVVRAVSPNQ